ncbi:MAG: hypothetical protein FJW31_07395 [Acidobacteria bacterium]|nr:hypothetical protein [Acidobacteriota bacterium]
MNIPHLTHTGRSEFYPKIRESLRQANGAWPVVPLDKTGGYSGDVTIAILHTNEDEVETDVELGDWTRFPARIRAAATALRDAGLRGRFEIDHEDGQLTVRQQP